MWDVMLPHQYGHDDGRLWAEIALFDMNRQVSPWILAKDGVAHILIPEDILVGRARFIARLPPPPDTMVPIDVYINMDLRAGDTVSLRDLRLDMEMQAIGAFLVEEGDLPEPDEDYDEEPYGTIADSDNEDREFYS